MRRMIGTALIACLIALPALGESALRGYWRVEQGDYVGNVLIDADNRAIWDSPLDGGRPARFRGYVESVYDTKDGTKVEIALTNGSHVLHVFCIMMSSELWHCRVRNDNTISQPFLLSRQRQDVPKLWSPQ